MGKITIKIRKRANIGTNGKSQLERMKTGMPSNMKENPKIACVDVAENGREIPPSLDPANPRMTFGILKTAVVHLPFILIDRVE